MHCWVSGAAHGACARVCVWVVVPCVAHYLLAGRVGWLVVVGVVCENCIVDASIFWKLLNGLFVGLLCVSLILSNLDIFE